MIVGRRADGIRPYNMTEGVQHLVGATLCGRPSTYDSTPIAAAGHTDPALQEDKGCGVRVDVGIDPYDMTEGVQHLVGATLCGRPSTYDSTPQSSRRNFHTLFT